MIKSKLQKIWQNRLVKSVLVVASGTAGAQAIGMAFIPFITRTYGPETYGTLGAFIALTGVLITLAALAYPVAIVLPKNDDTAQALVKLSLLIAAGMSLTVFVVLWFAGNWIMPKLGATTLMGFIFFIPLVMFLSACQVIAQQWLIRKKVFKGIASISIAHSLINYGSQALAGIYAPLAGVLISIHTLSIAIRTALTAYIGSKAVDVLGSKNKKNISLKKIAYKYRDFPIYRAPQMVLYAVSQSLPILMLTVFFGAATAGFYALTRTVLSVPINLLGGSVQSVFYPHINEAVLSNRKATPIILKAVTSLAVLGVLPFTVVVLWGPSLFEFAFGSDWEQAGKYAQWISIWMFFYLIERPAISAIPIFKLQRWFLILEIFSTLLKAFLIWFSFYFLNSALQAIAIFSIASVALSIYCIAKVLFISSNLDKRVDLVP